MELTVQNVYGLLLRSKLLSLDEARAMFARWNEEAKDSAGNLARFAAWMVANKYLTEYQAGLLARGHAEGFFLHDYKILGRLGKGRMAGVYKAQHRLGQIVAIKVLPPSKAKDPNLLARFQREAKLALRLRHPNIVRGFQMGEADGLHYLVMEHLEGETLEEVLAQRGKLSPTEGVRLIYQALQGLQHIHSQGVVHRDLKPANLMLTPAPGDNTLQCTVKILDIGLGRALYDEGFGETEAGLTGEGVLLGTPDYMAPEQGRDPRACDIRADIYSLGCVLYHTLGGQPPFPDTNIISQMIRHATEAPTPLRELNPAVPEGLEKIIGFMMAKEPSDRYPTPERAAQALRTFLAAEPAPLAAPDLDPNMHPYLNWLESKYQETNRPTSAASSRPEPLVVPPPPVPIPGRPPSGTVPSVPPVPGRPPSGTIPSAEGGAPSPSRNPSERPTRSGKPKTDQHPALRQDKQEALPAHAKPRKVKRPPRLVDQISKLEDPDSTVNVELVPLNEQPGPNLLAALAPTRRDFVVFGLGVGSTLFAIGLGYAFASLLRRRKPVEQPPSEEE